MRPRRASAHSAVRGHARDFELVVDAGALEGEGLLLVVRLHAADVVRPRVPELLDEFGHLRSGGSECSALWFRVVTTMLSVLWSSTSRVYKFSKPLLNTLRSTNNPLEYSTYDPARTLFISLKYSTNYLHHSEIHDDLPSLCTASAHLEHELARDAAALQLRGRAPGALRERRRDTFGARDPWALPGLRAERYRLASRVVDSGRQS